MNWAKVLDILMNENYVVHGFLKENSHGLHLARDQESQMLDAASRSRAPQFQN